MDQPLTHFFFKRKAGAGITQKPSEWYHVLCRLPSSENGYSSGVYESGMMSTKRPYTTSQLSRLYPGYTFRPVFFTARPEPFDEEAYPSEHFYMLQTPTAPRKEDISPFEKLKRRALETSPSQVQALNTTRRSTRKRRASPWARPFMRDLKKRSRAKARENGAEPPKQRENNRL